QLGDLANFRVAPEEHRGVLGLEGHDAGPRWTGRVPPVTSGNLVGHVLEAARQVVLPRLVPSLRLDALQRRADQRLFVRRNDEGKDDLAECPRLSELGEAPFGCHPRRRYHEDDGVAAADRLVELALPFPTDVEPAILVEIEK